MTCKHCGARIVTDSTSSTGWVHNDSWVTFCDSDDAGGTKAEPR